MLRLKKEDLEIFKSIATADEFNFLEKSFDDINDGSNDLRVGQEYQVLTIFYLAKQIELARISNDSSAKRMCWLTIVLAVSAALQVFIPIIHHL